MTRNEARRSDSKFGCMQGDERSCRESVYRPARRDSGSDIESEMHDIAFAHDVFLAFKTHLAGVARARLAFASNVISKANDLGPDEAVLEIRMDDTGGLRRGGPRTDSPGANLLGTRGEIGLQAKQSVGGANDAIKAGLLKTERCQEFGAIRLLKLCDFRFNGRAHRHRDRAFGARALLNGGKVGIVAEAIFGHVR